MIVSRRCLITATRAQEVLEAIYTRVGIVTKVPSAAVEEANVESLNVLNYPKGAEYTPHYDWGADGKVCLRIDWAVK